MDCVSPSWYSDSIDRTPDQTLIYDGQHLLDHEKLDAQIQPLEETEAVTAETKVYAELNPDAIKDEVRQLALSIEETFDDILHNLKNAKDIEKMSEELIEDTNRLIEKWKELQKAFREQVWKSKHVAGKACTTVEGLCKCLRREGS
ncbi:hypothetical protein QCA50_013570 [Cerrena zonata]|uniref:Uncharacterized protein n=1 Tax=Cerrena zonata TaxID=2478898 RepID=A0AAW0FQH0_9APHY